MNFIGLDIHKKTISYCVKDNELAFPLVRAVLGAGPVFEKMADLEEQQL